MRRESFYRLGLSVILVILACRHVDAAEAERLPNFVVVYADDLGYADIGCFGAKEIKTPSIDRLAAEGAKLTSFYVAQAVCSASRTALLTGCYPNRVGILGALGPKSPIGINAEEMTIAEVLKQRGYATAIYGKWHLGHHEKFLPTNHGFDDYFGLPYSNDMWPKHPEAAPGTYPELPLIEGTKVVDKNPDQTQLTTWYAERAVKFIAANKDKPFFLYVPHAMPHVPLYVSDKHAGKSKAGIYGDVIEEIDWSVGQILAALKEHGIDENTLVIFASDNGPWLSYGNHAGSAGPLREGKGTAWEGGVRVPFAARWPGKIPAGTVSSEVAATIDVLPTFAKLAGAPLPKRKIDGKDIWPLLAGAKDAKSPHEAYYFYWGRALHAVRAGKWKLHFPHGYRSLTGTPGKEGKPNGYSQRRTELALYDLEADVGETKNVAAEHADVVAQLKALAEVARADLGDERTKRQGTGVREAGKL
jgi:arylsulfatase A